MPDPTAIPADGSTSAKPHPPGGTETILVVEDDEFVRDFTTRMLRMLGYKVLSATNGREALDQCRRLGQPFDMVLTDMVMPNMTGKEFVQQLRTVAQGFKVLFVSGYSQDETVDGKVIGQDYAFLQKPYTRDTLAAKIREVLEEKK